MTVSALIAAGQVAQIRVPVLALPRNTSPVVPSSETKSPSLTVIVLPPEVAVKIFFASSMRIALAPTMQGRPIPRATTAAWLDLPPMAVRMPRATSMP